MNDNDPVQVPPTRELHPPGYYTGTLTGNPSPEEWAKIIAGVDAALFAAWDAWDAREKKSPK